MGDQLHLQAINALSSLYLCRKIIFLQNLLVLGFKKRKTSTGLRKNEEPHLGRWNSIVVVVGAGVAFHEARIL